MAIRKYVEAYPSKVPNAKKHKIGEYATGPS